MELTRIHKATAVYVGVALAGILIMLVAPMLVPSRYFADSARILEILYSKDVSWSGSYGGSAALYHYLYFGWIPPTWIAGAANILLATVLMRQLYRMLQVRWNALPFALIIPWTMMLFLYIGMYSKEIFTLVLCVLATHYALKRGLGRLFWTAVIFGLYALFVREYWGLIFVYFLSFYLISQIRIPVGYRLVICLVLLLMFSFAFHRTNGFFLTDTRLLLTLGREGNPDVQTLTTNLFVNSTVLHDVTNHMVAWLGFLFPIRLLMIGELQHVMFAFWQVVNVGLIVVALLRERTNFVDIPGSRSVSSADRSQAIRILVSFLAAVTLVHAAFEGDFGSYVRHQTAALPAFLVLLLLLYKPRTIVDDPPRA